MDRKHNCVAVRNGGWEDRCFSRNGGGYLREPFRNSRMGDFSHSPATADGKIMKPSAMTNRNFSSSPATVEFHFLLWSNYSHLGDFSEIFAALLNREGNSTFCHCIFLAQEAHCCNHGTLIPYCHVPVPQPAKRTRPTQQHSRLRCPMNINRKQMLELSIHRCIYLQSYSGSTHTHSSNLHVHYNSFNINIKFAEME